MPAMKKKRKQWKFSYIILAFFCIFYYCSNKKESEKNIKTNKNMNDKSYKKGTFGYDVDFMQQHQDDILMLKNDTGTAQLIISPEWQARVITSTSKGKNGLSYGWINYDLIESGEKQERMNAFGGEERFWLGPEGGQFSLFFKPGTEFKYENWYVPKPIDTEPFQLVEANDTAAYFKKQMELTNYAETTFKILVEREIHLLSTQDIKSKIGIGPDRSLKIVGFESKNTITNTGDNEWNKKTGMPSIWILGMYVPSPDVTVIIPFRTGDFDELGPIINSGYFGAVPDDRLNIKENTIFFKADGNYRSKIGIPPKRAKKFTGSYDQRKKVLTLINYSLPADKTDYVNSLWEKQDKPFSGDAINAYNDGKVEDGSQLGPFYELESSSPAANLKPGEKLTHIHRTIHIQGHEDKLNAIAKYTLGVGIDTIKDAF